MALTRSLRLLDDIMARPALSNKPSHLTSSTQVENVRSISAHVRSAQLLHVDGSLLWLDRSELLYMRLVSKRLHASVGFVCLHRKDWERRWKWARKKRKWGVDQLNEEVRNPNSNPSTYPNPCLIPFVAD